MNTTNNGSILVTGAAGKIGAVGRTVTGLLLERGLLVRAMVRREDDRAAALRAAGAEVVVGDLLEPADVFRVVSGCRRVYFGMSVSAGYLEASVTMAAVAREVGVDALVNMSQMTASAAAALAQRAGARVVRSARHHYPADSLPGGLLSSRNRSERPRPRAHRTAVRAGQDLSGCHG